MKLGHDLRTLADRRAHPLHRSRAHVADGENAGGTRLQGKRLADWAGLAIPALSTCAGLDKALGIERNAALEPVGRRVGTDEQKEMAEGLFGFLARWAVTPADTIELALRRAG